MRKYILLSLLKALMGAKKERRPYPTDDIFVYDRAGREIYREPKRGRRHEQKPKFFRYAKYAAVAGVVSVFLLGGLLIWGTVAAVNYAGDFLRGRPPAVSMLAEEGEKLREALSRPADEQLAQGKAKAAEMLNKPLTTEACLNKLTGALNPATWLTVPLAAHWQKVREACVERS
jgi:hypothetical protein